MFRSQQDAASSTGLDSFSLCSSRSLWTTRTNWIAWTTYSWLWAVLSKWSATSVTWRISTLLLTTTSVRSLKLSQRMSLCQSAERQKRRWESRLTVSLFLILSSLTLWLKESRMWRNTWWWMIYTCSKSKSALKKKSVITWVTFSMKCQLYHHMTLRPTRICVSLQKRNSKSTCCLLTCHLLRLNKVLTFCTCWETLMSM